jgi:hypothetical protein
MFSHNRHKIGLIGILLFAVMVTGIGCATQKSKTTAPDESMKPVNAVEAFASGKDASAYGAEVATAWYRLVHELIKEERLKPPRASRSLAYMGVALYESVVDGMDGYRSLAGLVNGLSDVPRAGGGEYYWPAAANAALARMAVATYPSSETREAVADLKRDLDKMIGAGAPASVVRSSEKYGRDVARAIIAWSNTDGYDELYPCEYTPPEGRGLWVPTPQLYLSALEPCWDELRPFVMSSAYAHDPGPPPEYSEEPGSRFYQEAQEVYETVANLTEEQIDIARYWADNPEDTATPPGHAMMILTQVIEQQGFTLDVAAEAYAKLGMGVADAFISCWWTKYEYSLIRPITYIRRVMEPNWPGTVIGTPNFPEYTSGHSVVSGASAQVLTDLFGDIPFTDYTHELNRKIVLEPRSFDTFIEYAREAAISRLYAGIHFRAAIDLGVEQGRDVGRAVSELPIRE